MLFPKHDPEIKTKIYNYIGKLLSQDSILKIEIIGKRKRRTDKQNAWLWSCIYPIFLQAGINQGWEYTNIDQVHEFCKYTFTKDSIVNRDTGEIITFPRSTSIMNTLEFFTYCDLIRDHALDYFGVMIPEPDPEWRKKETQINIDKE